jgi:hypothetical protein
MSTPLRRHWKVGMGEPDAPAVNRTVCPGQTSADAGMEVKAGGTWSESVAASLAMLWQGLVATQS